MDLNNNILHIDNDEDFSTLNNKFNLLMKPYNSFGLKLANKVDEHIFNKSDDNTEDNNTDNDIARANMINSASKNPAVLNAIADKEKGERSIGNLSKVGLFLNSLASSAKEDMKPKAEVVSGFYVPETNGALNALDTLSDGTTKAVNAIDSYDDKVAKDNTISNMYQDLGKGEVEADNKKQDQALQLIDAKLKATQNDPMYQAKLKLYQNKIAEDDNSSQVENIKNTLTEASNILNSIPEAYFGVGFTDKSIRYLGMLRGTDQAQAYQDYTTRIHTLLGYIVRDMFKGGRITNMEVKQAEKTLSDPTATKQTNIDLLNTLMQKLTHSNTNAIYDHLKELNSGEQEDEDKEASNVQASNNTQTNKKYNIKIKNNNLSDIGS